ncbi:MAG: hypothetical protein GQ574_18935 [Crocinitomix sp.]|nr:hypothetical protein [Crocinitomix sp.]
MDDLQQIVHSFSDNKQKEFRQFIQRNRFKTSRIDLDLFNLFAKEKSYGKDEILLALYGENKEDRNAYHSVRKRLVKHLNDFIYLLQIDNDESLASEISKNLILVRHLFNNNLDKLAWKQLKKSENLADKAELNQQLQSIYELQIEHYDGNFVVGSLKELVQKRRQTAELAQEDQNLKIIGSFVKQELEKVKIEAQDLDLERILDLLLNTFDMKDSLFRRPKLRYNFVLIARGIILANKEFYSFEEYVINNYNKISDSGYFDSRPTNRLNILYIVSHTLYRNKKFDEAILYLEKMQTYLGQVGKGIFNRFNVKYRMLLAACENLRGNVLESIEILEGMNPSKLLLKEHEFNAQLNLSIYYFQIEEYKKANQQLIKMGRTDNWFEKNMGVEWRIKKNMIDVIYQYELGRTEIALDRILSIERIHKDLLQTDKYKRISVFLGLIKRIIKNPLIIDTEEFLDRVESSFVWIEVEQEDLQAVSYYAWLKSKMTKQKFYAVLRDLMVANES